MNGFVRFVFLFVFWRSNTTCLLIRGAVNYTSAGKILSLTSLTGANNSPTTIRRMNACVITLWLAITTARWLITVA
jgi:hypothetical protein